MSVSAVAVLCVHGARAKASPASEGLPAAGCAGEGIPEYVHFCRETSANFSNMGHRAQMLARNFMDHGAALSLRRLPFRSDSFLCVSMENWKL